MKQAQEMLKTLDFMMEMQPDSIKVGLTKGCSANLRVCGQGADLQVASLNWGLTAPAAGIRASGLFGCLHAPAQRLRLTGLC